MLNFLHTLFPSLFIPLSAHLQPTRKPVNHSWWHVLINPALNPSCTSGWDHFGRAGGWTRVLWLKSDVPLSDASIFWVPVLHCRDQNSWSDWGGFPVICNIMAGEKVLLILIMRWRPAGLHELQTAACLLQQLRLVCWHKSTKKRESPMYY